MTPVSRLPNWTRTSIADFRNTSRMSFTMTRMNHSIVYSTPIWTLSLTESTGHRALITTQNNNYYSTKTITKKQTRESSTNRLKRQYEMNDNPLTALHGPKAHLGQDWGTPHTCLITLASFKQFSSCIVLLSLSTHKAVLDCTPLSPHVTEQVLHSLYNQCA